MADGILVDCGHANGCCHGDCIEYFGCNLSCTIICESQDCTTCSSIDCPPTGLGEPLWGCGVTGNSIPNGQCDCTCDCGNDNFPHYEDIQNPDGDFCQEDDSVSTITGCTNENAINYNSQATVDDGTCIFSESDCPSGCSDECQSCNSESDCCNHGDLNVYGDEVLDLTCIGGVCQYPFYDSAGLFVGYSCEGTCAGLCEPCECLPGYGIGSYSCGYASTGNITGQYSTCCNDYLGTSCMSPTGDPDGQKICVYGNLPTIAPYDNHQCSEIGVVAPTTAEMCSPCSFIKTNNEYNEIPYLGALNPHYCKCGMECVLHPMTQHGFLGQDGDYESYEQLPAICLPDESDESYSMCGFDCPGLNYDCTGVCDGTNVVGCDGVCGSGLVEDCNGDCGGDAQDFGCGCNANPPENCGNGIFTCHQDGCLPSEWDDLEDFSKVGYKQGMFISTDDPTGYDSYTGSSVIPWLPGEYDECTINVELIAAQNKNEIVDVGKTNCSLIQETIDNALFGDVICLPNGTYPINTSENGPIRLNKDGITLKGAGPIPQQTKLWFFKFLDPTIYIDNAYTSHIGPSEGIIIGNKPSLSNTSTITSTGNDWIESDIYNSLEYGDMIKIEVEIDESFINYYDMEKFEDYNWRPGWKDFEIKRTLGKTDNKIYVDTPFRYPLSLDIFKNIRVSKITNMSKDIGVRDLYVSNAIHYDDAWRMEFTCDGHPEYDHMCNETTILLSGQTCYDYNPSRRTRGGRGDCPQWFGNEETEGIFLNCDEIYTETLPGGQLYDPTTGTGSTFMLPPHPWTCSDLSDVALLLYGVFGVTMNCCGCECTDSESGWETEGMLVGQELTMCQDVDIEGCTNPSACNYDESATIDNGTCLYNDCAGVCGGSATDCGCGCGVTCVDSDNDGTWDCVDDCVGSLDCAGDCNGTAVDLGCGCNQPQVECWNGKIVCNESECDNPLCKGARYPSSNMYLIDMRNCYDCFIDNIDSIPVPEVFSSYPGSEIYPGVDWVNNIGYSEPGSSVGVSDCPPGGLIADEENVFTLIIIELYDFLRELFCGDHCNPYCCQPGASCECNVITTPTDEDLCEFYKGTFNYIVDANVPHDNKSNVTNEVRHILSNGIKVENSKNVTILNTKMELPENRGERTNGYPFRITKSNDILVYESEGYRGRHNFSVGGWGTSGVVFGDILSKGGWGFGIKTRFIAPDILSNLLPPNYTLEDFEDLLPEMFDTDSDFWSRYLRLEILSIFFGYTGHSDTHSAMSNSILVTDSDIYDGWFSVNRDILSGGQGHTTTNTLFWNIKGHRNAGCTDQASPNYDPTATADDGSCIFICGCIDPIADNYCSTCSHEDGSCAYHEEYVCQGSGYYSAYFENESGDVYFNNPLENHDPDGNYTGCSVQVQDCDEHSDNHGAVWVVLQGCHWESVTSPFYSDGTCGEGTVAIEGNPDVWNCDKDNPPWCYCAQTGNQSIANNFECLGYSWSDVHQDSPCYSPSLATHPPSLSCTAGIPTIGSLPGWEQMSVPGIGALASFQPTAHEAVTPYNNGGIVVGADDINVFTDTNQPQEYLEYWTGIVNGYFGNEQPEYISSLSNFATMFISLFGNTFSAAWNDTNWMELFKRDVAPFNGESIPLLNADGQPDWNETPWWGDCGDYNAIVLAVEGEYWDEGTSNVCNKFWEETANPFSSHFGEVDCYCAGLYGFDMDAPQFNLTFGIKDNPPWQPAPPPANPLDITITVDMTNIGIDFTVRTVFENLSPDPDFEIHANVAHAGTPLRYQKTWTAEYDGDPSLESSRVIGYSQEEGYNMYLGPESPCNVWECPDQYDDHLDIDIDGSFIAEVLEDFVFGFIATNGMIFGEVASRMGPKFTGLFDETLNKDSFIKSINTFKSSNFGLTLGPDGSHSGTEPNDMEYDLPGDRYTNLYLYQYGKQPDDIGDTNQDGIVNVIDVVAAVSCILSSGIVGQGNCVPQMDINGDGVVNIQDIVGIVQMVLGTRVSSNDRTEITKQLNRLIKSDIPTKSEKQQLNELKRRPTKQISTVRSLKPRKQKSEQNLYYVKYNTRLTSQQLNQKKSEHGLISIKHATKRTDLIPSAKNVVIVEGGDINKIKQDPNVVLVEPVPVYKEEFNDPISNMSLQTNDFNRVNYLEAIEEFGYGTHYPMIGQMEGQWQVDVFYNNPDINESKVIPLNETIDAEYPFAHHALEVASLMIAETDNNYGMASYCPNCTLGFVNTWGVPPYGWGPNSIEILIENGIKVANISLGGPQYSQTHQDAINDAYQQGLVIVASAGNDNTNNDTNPHYPSNYDNIIGVAGSDYSSSNYGLQYLDVSAPSNSNLVATRGYNMGAASCVDEFGNDTDPWGDSCWFRTTSGTSFGAPIVTALMGLLLSHNPNLTNVDLVDIVLATIGPQLGGSQPVPGEVNFHEALSYMYENYVEQDMVTIPGDTNLDGIVNIIDVVALVDMVINIFENGYTPTEQDLQTYDLTGDGTINVIDVVALVNIVVSQGVRGNGRAEIDKQLQRLINSGVSTKSEKQQLRQQLNKVRGRWN